MKVTLEKFTPHLSKFLSDNSIVDGKFEVIFATEAQRNVDGYIIYGMVKLDGVHYKFRVKYFDTDKKVVIESPLFYFEITVNEVVEFLKEVES